MAHAGRDLGAVLLDLHAPAAPVAELAPGKVAVDVLGAQLQPGRKALDDRGQPGTVGLAGGYKAQGHGRLTLQTGLRVPVLREPRPALREPPRAGTGVWNDSYQGARRCAVGFVTLLP